VSQRWSPIILQRAKHRIGIDLVSGAVQETAAIITANVIAMRSDRTIDISAQVVVQDGASDSETPASGNAVAAVGANRAVSYGTAALDTGTREGSIVTADCAVSERHRT
jgi:hypothetical protein